MEGEKENSQWLTVESKAIWWDEEGDSKTSGRGRGE